MTQHSPQPVPNRPSRPSSPKQPGSLNQPSSRRSPPTRTPGGLETPTHPPTVALAAPSVALEAPEASAVIDAVTDPVRTLRTALGALGLLLSETPQHLFPWSVLPALGSAFAGHRFELASLSDGQAMPAELAAHLAAPPPWTAAVKRFAARTGEGMPDLIAWTAGYSGARKHFFASRGAFIPLHAARARDVPCHYAPDAEGQPTADQQAFVVGAAAYLSAVRLGSQDRQLPPSAHLPGRPSPSRSLP